MTTSTPAARPQIYGYAARMWDSTLRRHYLILNCLHGEDAVLNGTILATPHDKRRYRDQVAANVEEMNERRAELGLSEIVVRGRWEETI